MSIKQNIGNVRVMSSNRKKSKHDYRHHIDISMNLGDIAPTHCLLCHPGDDIRMKQEQLVWVAPIVHPVFGTLKYHQWHYFVKMSDLSTNFAALLSQTRISRESTFVPEEVAYIRKGILSMCPMFESFCTIWRVNGPASDLSATFHLPGSNLANPQYVQDLVTAGVLRYKTGRKFDGLDGYELNMRALLGNDLFTHPNGAAYTANQTWWLPLSNPTAKTFMDSRTDSNGDDYRISGVNCTPVTFEKADYVIEKVLEINGQQYRYAFLFRFTDFGRRLKKCMEAAGIRMDCSSTQYKSFMGLFAIYKAYFDCFGLLQYQNWEDTPAAKLLYMMDHINDTQLNYFLNNGTAESGNKKVIQDNFLKFFMDLGFMYVTESATYVSATTRQDAVSPQVSSDFLSVTPDVNQGNGGAAISNGTDVRDSEGNPSGVPGATTANNHAFINKIFHGQMDAELLKKLYLWTNRNTIAGQRVYELLKLQGLGTWADSQKVRFIGHTEVDINFETVTSTADTLQSASGQGRLLGERGAKAQAYSGGKTLKYKVDEIGFYVVLSAVVPESGYLQQDDGRSDCIRKFDFYNPEFDAVGYEAMRKSQVCGELLWVNESNKVTKPLDQTFGFHPRYTSQKVVPSKAMGDFSLRSERENFLGFTLDRYLDLNSHNQNAFTLTSGGSNPTSRDTEVTISMSFNAEDLPVAGTIWRYPTRYPWLGHQYRIFALIGDFWGKFVESSALVPSWDAHDIESYELFARTYDNFLVQLDVDLTCYTQKLQIGDSYETTSDGNEGATDTNVSHA